MSPQAPPRPCVEQVSPARLAATLPVKSRPSYSPDGGTIVYVSDVSPRAAEGGRLYVMAADGQGSRLLGADPDLYGADYPVFSPDGRKIACTVHGERSIYLMDADGSNGAVVASLPGVTNLSFSPDGSLLLFETYFGSGGMQAGMHLVSLDGKNRTYLGFQGMDSSFSPDGRRIVFYTLTDDGHAVIEIMDRDGSNRRPIFRTPWRGADVQPRFSRDGSRIVFVSGPRYDRGLYIMSSDGTEVRRVSPHYSGLWRKLAPAILAGTGLVLAILGGIRLARRPPGPPR